MYELVWEGNGFTIVQRQAKLDSKGRVLPLPTASSAGRNQEVDLKTWKRFVSTGRGDLAGLHAPIRESWKRCWEMGVDPAYGKCWDVRSGPELGPGFQHLAELVEETKSQIYSLFKDKGLLVTISDRQGYLVGMCGDYKTLLEAGVLNFGPGANWSEKSVGTNAIGTALASGKPLQVVGREHFCQGHHGWICSAAPIYDIGGQVLGCLDISGPIHADHTHALILAIKGARAIENRLFRQQTAELQQRSSQVIQSVLDVLGTGLVYLDTSKVIRAVNGAAAMILGSPPEQLIGLPAEKIFRLGRAFRVFKTLSGRYEREGVMLRHRRNPMLNVRAFPLLSRGNALAGLLLVVREPQRFTISVPSLAPVGQDPFASIVGRSEAIRSAVAVSRRIAPTPTTVLITGENGTGKDLFARAIHEASRRAQGPFIAVNCGAIPKELIQSVLFGYVEGAFTGARRGGSAGQFEAASGGTLLLDEISEMPLSMQVNLLRVLEESQVTRVGATKPIAIDVRVIAATNKDLKLEMEEGRFREDLFYRLNVIRIALPPLREREDDLLLLADHFVSKLSEKLERPVRRVGHDFYEALRNYHWPGNVRELRHAIEAAIALMPGDILGAATLPDYILGGERKPRLNDSSEPTFNLKEVQRQTILRAYTHFQGNISHTAKALGIGRNTLYEKLKKLGIIEHGEAGPS